MTLKNLLLIVFLFVSCSSIPEKKEPVPASAALTAAFQSAKVSASKKDFRSALIKFNGIIAKAPDSHLAVEAHIAIGDIYFSQKRWDEAYISYMKVVNGLIQTPLEAEAGIKATQCLIKEEKYPEALQHIDATLKIQSLSKDALFSGLKLRLQILKQIGAPLEEVKTLLHLHANASNETQKQEYKLQAVSIVENTLSVQQLEEVAGDSKYGFAQPPALFRIGLLRFERSEFSEARSYLSTVVQTAPNTELAERSNDLLNQIRAREQVNPRRIGVVLPLTGRLQKVGYKTLRGIQLGLGIFGRSRSGIELAVVDSAGNPATARRAVEKLVVEDHVIAIIGSLSSREASAIASKAQELGVPNIALSQKSGLTEVGDFVFRNALTSETQVKHLVNEAIKVRGINRFAILYPKDSYGVEFANLFWDEVVRQGGEIRGVQSYKSGETDFNLPIKKLVGTDDTEARKWEFKLRLEEYKKNKPQYTRKNETSNLLPPIIDFEGVFIPDSARALGQIAPTLAYNDVKDITLIGTNLWNTPSTIERAGKHLKDPLFIDSFLTSDVSVQNTAFYQDFSKTFGEPPEDFELQAFDSAIIFRSILESGASTRSEVQSRLSNLSQLQGALGPLSVTESREVARPVVLLTIKDNQIVRTTEATSIK